MHERPTHNIANKCFSGLRSLSPASIFVSGDRFAAPQSLTGHSVNRWRTGAGKIFPLMDNIINLGIDAKHFNEDQIAPFTEWIDKFSQRIGLFGGFDLNLLVLEKPETVYRSVVEQGTLFRRTAKEYGLGSGNSIPEYIPVDGFMAMIEAVNEIWRKESSK